MLNRSTETVAWCGMFICLRIGRSRIFKFAKRTNLRKLLCSDDDKRKNKGNKKNERMEMQYISTAVQSCNENTLNVVGDSMQRMLGSSTAPTLVEPHAPPLALLQSE